LKSLKKKGSKTKRGKAAEGPTFELVLGNDDRHQAAAAAQDFNSMAAQDNQIRDQE